MDPAGTENDTMKTTNRPPASKRSARRALVTTLGDLISAAYDAVPGAGSQRLQLAVALLTRSPLARQLHPHVSFTH
jgi:hypothetical protein